jgi:hypothetical protein
MRSDPPSNINFRQLVAKFWDFWKIESLADHMVQGKCFSKIGFYTIVRLIKARRTIEEFSSAEISLTMVISG